MFSYEQKLIGRWSSLHSCTFKSLTVKMFVCFYHVTYVFTVDYTLWRCLNLKELLIRSRFDIWRLNDCNGTRTHNHLVCKRTLSHLVFAEKLSGRGIEFVAVKMLFTDIKQVLLLTNEIEVSQKGPCLQNLMDFSVPFPSYGPKFAQLARNCKLSLLGTISGSSA